MMQSGACLSALWRLIGCRFEWLFTIKFIAIYAYFMPATCLFCFKFRVLGPFYLLPARPCHGACDALRSSSPRAMRVLAH